MVSFSFPSVSASLLTKTLFGYLLSPLLTSQIHYILDEIVMGGMVCETNLQEVLQAVDGQNKLEKAPTPAKGSPVAAGGKKF